VNVREGSSRRARGGHVPFRMTVLLLLYRWWRILGGADRLPLPGTETYCCPRFRTNALACPKR